MLDPLDRWLEKRSISRALVGLAIALVGAQILLVAMHSERYQWDFRSYYYGARAYFFDGANPYDFRALRETIGANPPHDGNNHPFLYPLHTLVFFRIIAGLPYTVSYYIYLAAKIGMLLLLGRLLTRWLSGIDQVGALCVLSVVIFNSPVANDLRTGNISIFETGLILLAFELLGRGRVFGFAGCIVFAGCFKLMPLALLGTLLVVRGTKPKLAFAAGIGAMVVLFTASFLFDEKTTLAFFHVTERVSRAMSYIGANRGPLNLSLGRLVGDVVYLVGGREIPWLTLSTYVVAAGIIALTTLYGLARLRGDPSAVAARRRAALVLLGYGLIVPRLPGYAVLILVIPVIYVIGSARISTTWRWLLVVASALPTHYVSRYVFGLADQRPPESLLALPWDYSPTTVIAICWTVAVAQWGGDAAIPAEADDTARSGAARAKRAPGPQG